MSDLQAILDDFAFLDDWDERYKYIIDLGRALPDFPEDKRDDLHKVRGCASQVWLNPTQKDGRLYLEGDSDAHIVRGLVAIMIALYSGKTPNEISAINVTEALASLDLAEHLTPQRSNGLAAMDKKIHDIATAMKAA